MVSRSAGEKRSELDIEKQGLAYAYGNQMDDLLSRDICKKVAYLSHRPCILFTAAYVKNTRLDNSSMQSDSVY
ncbi:hypothetical protein TNCV_5004741 [Trichonephila clavipes]|uniref:Uncharacterized protein n=1 Tax=Trichonephila clavipes TaxID=2585209 RepID=A0A8X6RK95_TRICX|nr:hypothetical protein TNCV_5004741 [Trichonephila clavipes]